MNLTIEDALKLPTADQPEEEVAEVLFGTSADGTTVEVIISINAESQFQTTRFIRPE